MARFDVRVTQRELEILTAVSNGHTYIRVARAMFLSVHTVKAHMEHIRGKLGARNGVHAVAIAIREGIIE